MTIEAISAREFLPARLSLGSLREASRGRRTSDDRQRAMDELVADLRVVAGLLR